MKSCAFFGHHFLPVSPYMACEHAYKRKKPIISMIDGWRVKDDD